MIARWPPSTEQHGYDNRNWYSVLHNQYKRMVYRCTWTDWCRNQQHQLGPATSILCPILWDLWKIVQPSRSTCSVPYWRRKNVEAGQKIRRTMTALVVVQLAIEPSWLTVVSGVQRCHIVAADAVILCPLPFYMALSKIIFLSRRQLLAAVSR